MPITRACDRCGASYTRAPSLAGKYCSPACAYAARRKEVPGTRYRMLHRPGHPLAGKSPYIPEHRVVLWEKIGPGVHFCHHCGESVAWTTGQRNQPGSLVADHLDRDTHNNAAENLVPSCVRCNIMNRQATVDDAEDFRIRRNGTRLRGERRTCETCSTEFVAWERREGKGRFCSRSCARRAPRT